VPATNLEPERLSGEERCGPRLDLALAAGTVSGPSRLNANVATAPTSTMCWGLGGRNRLPSRRVISLWNPPPPCAMGQARGNQDLRRIPGEEVSAPGFTGPRRAFSKLDGARGSTWAWVIACQHDSSAADRNLAWPERVVTLSKVWCP
jgi:hypothetical protein